MRIDIFHHFPADFGSEPKLAEILRVLRQLVTGVSTMAQTMDDLVQAISDQRGDINSMKVFISGLEQAIKDALSGVTLPPAVQAKVDAAFADVKANSQEIKDAIDNDPATPAPPPPPDPVP